MIASLALPIGAPIAGHIFNQAGVAILNGLDLLWRYREGIGIIVGLLLLVMIVDNLAAIHRELEHLRLNLDGRDKAPAPRRRHTESESLNMESEEWRAE